MQQHTFTPKLNLKQYFRNRSLEEVPKQPFPGKYKVLNKMINLPVVKEATNEDHSRMSSSITKKPREKIQFQQSEEFSQTKDFRHSDLLPSSFIHDEYENDPKNMSSFIKIKSAKDLTSNLDMQQVYHSESSAVQWQAPTKASPKTIMLS